MDNDQLRQIAVGALTGHWPAHLGLPTDADRIDWLARQVERLTDEAVDVERLQDDNDALQATIDDLRTTIDSAKQSIREAQDSLA